MDPVKLPYAISNFRELRRGGFYYVDKTPFIRILEDDALTPRYCVFLRPRRFGKSLFLSTLEHYYDVAWADAFDELFGGLAIARNPTPERNRYLVLDLEFTGMAGNRNADALRASFSLRLRARLQRFFQRYQALIPEAATRWHEMTLGEEPAELLYQFLTVAEATPYQVYLLVDEYDNFTNELIARGSERVYYELVQSAGFFKEFFKTVKEGTRRGVIARIFMTGVSPITLDDLTSGANIFSILSLKHRFDTLAGFTEDDVRELVGRVLAQPGFRLSEETVLEDLRRYYDGYRFSTQAEERLYNPDMVLYFLRRLRPPDRYPEELLDYNVRMDYGRLRSLLVTSDGRPRHQPLAAVQSLLADRSLRARIRDAFPLSEAYQEEYFVSFLFYLGMITIDKAVRSSARLVVPNYVIDQMIWQTMSTLLAEVVDARIPQVDLISALEGMAFEGEIRAFLELVYHRVVRRLSNRDLVRLDERGMKFVLLAYLSLSDLFYPFSEFELNGGYSDLVLTLNRRYPGARYSWLLELKYLKVREATEARVREALAEADGQLRAYLADERLAGVAGPGGWKAVSLVFVGTEALYVRELGGELVVFRREDEETEVP